MSDEWYYESDGGTFWDGSRWRKAAKTHYIVSRETHERIDCSSRREAVTLAGAKNEARSLLPAIPIDSMQQHEALLSEAAFKDFARLHKVEWERSATERVTYYYFEVTGVVMFKKKVRVKVRMRLWDDELKALWLPDDAWTIIGRMSPDEQTEVLLRVLAAKAKQQSDDVAMKWIVLDM